MLVTVFTEGCIGEAPNGNTVWTALSQKLAIRDNCRTKWVKIKP